LIARLIDACGGERRQWRPCTEIPILH
jgi:hypothetical protein